MHFMIRTQQILFIALIAIISQWSCEIDPPIPQYKTRNVIVVVIDGSRYSETWGDTIHQYIPRLANELSDKGVVYTQFYNNGPTYTIAGHTAITTGNYQEINNSGMELPENPSMFQYWMQTYHQEKNAAWIITGKDKLEILSDCNDPEWKGTYQSSTNCGVNGLGLGSGNRDDSSTFNIMLDILSGYHPQLVLINFSGPDFAGHSNDWNRYINEIKNSDEYIYQLLNFIESDKYYKSNTTVFVTNDHGRHLDSIADGFISHGDNCEGCRHVILYAYGPDFKQDTVIDIKRGLIDISSTIAKLLNFEMPKGKGKVMHELFK